MRWSVGPPPQPFTLLVRFQIGEGKHEDAEAPFAKTRELTLRENGVIAFELHREARNANRSVVYERWKSLAALEEHLPTPYISRTSMLIQKFDDGILAEIDVEALHLDLHLARREALLDLYPAEFGDNVRRRPLVDPRVALGVTVARSIDGHRFYSKRQKLLHCM